MIISRKFSLYAVLLAVAMLLPSGGRAASEYERRDSSDLDRVATSVARLLEQGHYSRQKLDDSVSKRLLRTYLDQLDPNHLYFTQEDVDKFRASYATTLDDAILSGDLTPARIIFAVYRKRVEDRVAKNEKIATRKFKFNSNETIDRTRKDAPWPSDEAHADEMWRKFIEAQLLEESLSEHAIDPPEKVVLRRQDKVLRGLHEMDEDEVVKTFLTSLAQSYDPHSEYLSPADLKNFEIQMKTSLIGVGAVLESDGGYAKVRELVVGGPADNDGRLKVGDRISAVAQGDGDFEDVVDMKLDKVVEKIRGKKGTIVRLQVIPANATDSSKRKVIAIRRDEVQLKDQLAKAEIVDLKQPDGRVSRLGWITLPSFYADMQKRGMDGARSTTRDVLVLLTRLKQEGIESLVMDLRNNGGGSLDEAINLTGLFIPKGPVVQAKDSNGKIVVNYDKESSVAYSGPIVVLVNRLSASASEIFAAALQDYGRAVIVGDQQTFGKGTVQTMLEIGRFMPMFSIGSENAGALKLTINKFYRVKGGSTQLEGVKSDIILPSLSDVATQIGESALPNPLPYDEVAPQKLQSSGDLASFIPELRSRAEARIALDPEFRYVLEDAAQLKNIIAENRVSLNAKTRRDELAADKEKKEKRKAERASRGPAVDAIAYEITLDDAVSPQLRQVAFDREPDPRKAALNEDGKPAEEEEARPDAVRNEALRIAADLGDLVGAKRTAAIRNDGKEPQ